MVQLHNEGTCVALKAANLAMAAEVAEAREKQARPTEQLDPSPLPPPLGTHHTPSHTSPW